MIENLADVDVASIPRDEIKDVFYLSTMLLYRSSEAVDEIDVAVAVIEDEITFAFIDQALNMGDTTAGNAD